MSLSLEETYFGWRELPHAENCTRPVWTVDIREDEAYRPTWQGSVERHTCSNEDCEHGGRYARTTMRVVCSSCHRAHVLNGEAVSTRTSTTRATGYGETPRKAAGLFLWPGEPWFGEEPRAWLVSAGRPVRLHLEDVVGAVFQGRGPRGGQRLSATATPSPSGPYGVGSPIRWTSAQDGFPSLTAAAKWIAAQMPEGGAA